MKLRLLMITAAGLCVVYGENEKNSKDETESLSSDEPENHSDQDQAGDEPNQNPLLETEFFTYSAPEIQISEDSLKAFASIIRPQPIVYIRGVEADFVLAQSDKLIPPDKLNVYVFDQKFEHGKDAQEHEDLDDGSGEDYDYDEPNVPVVKFVHYRDDDELEEAKLKIMKDVIDLAGSIDTDHEENNLRKRQSKTNEK